MNPECQVLFANILCSEYGNEWRRRCGSLDAWAALRFFPFYEAHGADDVKPEFTSSFDGLHGGSSRGANVIDNDNAGAFFAETFDALPGAVLLLRLANQESMNCAADDGDGNHDGVCAHREAANRLRAPATFFNFFQKYLAGQLRSARV